MQAIAANLAVDISTIYNLLKKHSIPLRPRVCTMLFDESKERRVYNSTPDMTRTEKKCSACKKIKYVFEFTKNKRTKDGYQAYCRDCHRAQMQAYYQSGGKERSRINGTKWRATPKGGELSALSNFRQRERRKILGQCKTCNNKHLRESYEV